MLEIIFDELVCRIKLMFQLMKQLHFLMSEYTRICCKRIYAREKQRIYKLSYSVFHNANLLTDQPLTEIMPGQIMLRHIDEH